jgi:predicted alpha/beta superfamily hydrolase
MKNLLIIILLHVITHSVYGQKAKQQVSSRPFVLGEVHDLPSKILGENRILNIYTPDGYNPKDSITYPVIYLLDGSADEDFIHVAGIVQYYSFEWISLVQKSIVVGIATVDRRRDFTFPTTIEADKKRFPTTGHSDKFISFIATELQPYINKNFKTTSSKTIIGQSLGGLLATEILFKRPDLFNQYIIVSPSLWWDNGSLLDQPAEILKNTFTQPTAIYLAVGKEGLTPTAIPRVMAVDVNVLADKIKASKSKTVQVIFDYLPQENHATIMHQAVLNAFKQLHAINLSGK